MDKATTYIPFSPPLINEEEIMEVVKSLRSGWITTGPKTKQFEVDIQRFTTAPYAVATSACTEAMKVALHTLGLKEGDEVITTPFTFASTGHVICYFRAKPVFVDVELDTYNINPEKISEKITAKTKIILPVHFAGHACDMDPIMSIAHENNLYVMEDAAHAIGTKYKGRMIGSIGDVTCFSFYATKNLTTAEGGIAVTHNEAWSRKMRMLTMYGISDAREIWQERYTKSGSIHYDIKELGYKCNMTDISASIGIHQLANLEAFNQTREQYAQVYNRAFAEHPGLTIPTIKEYTHCSRHLYPILLNSKYIRGVCRDELIDKLKVEFNIGTSVLFMPLHMHSFYRRLLKHQVGDFPVSEDLFRRQICLPLSPKLTYLQIEKVAESVLYILEQNKR